MMGYVLRNALFGAFCHHASIIRGTYTNLVDIAHYTSGLHGIAYCSFAIRLYNMLPYKTTQD